MATAGTSYDRPNFSKALEFLESRKFNVNFNLHNSGYRAIENIGTGAYGVVCSAVKIATGEEVAIKKIPNATTNSTVIKRTLREVKILRYFNHENIISVKDLIMQKNETVGLDVYMVLDLMESDLHQIIHSKQPLTNQHAQYFIYQILKGLKYIHSANIIHRDLKPSNLMVNSDCLLKIGDFGMARSINDPTTNNGVMTQYVATRWYRAPELLFSMLDYSTAVDVWSAGCIFAELISRRQLFPGKDPLSQLKLIVLYLGTPSPSVMQHISSEIVRGIITGVGYKEQLPWNEILPKATPLALDLISKMMQLAHWERISAAKALEHLYLDLYSDPPNEPCCDQFLFDKDYDGLGKEALAEELLREVTIKSSALTASEKEQVLSRTECSVKYSECGPAQISVERCSGNKTSANLDSGSGSAIPVDYFADDSGQQPCTYLSSNRNMRCSCSNEAILMQPMQMMSPGDFEGNSDSCAYYRVPMQQLLNVVPAVDSGSDESLLNYDAVNEPEDMCMGSPHSDNN